MARPAGRKRPRPDNLLARSDNEAVTLVSAAAVPEPGWSHVLTAWTFQPLVVVPLVAAAWLYLAGVRRVAERYPLVPWPIHRTAWFLSGLAILGLALESPVDIYSNVFLWVHMIQHLLIMNFVAISILLAAPITLALRASSTETRRRWLHPILQSRPVKVLSYPLVTWLLFGFVLVVAHFTPLYERSLEHQWIHDLEHMLFLAGGLLFWWPIVGLDPSPWRLPHPLRILYAFLAIPVNTFVALAIYSSQIVLYGYYSQVPRTWGPSPLTDQHWAGAIMWLAGDMMLMAAVIVVALGWMKHDEAEARRIDARLDAEEARRAALER